MGDDKMPLLQYTCKSLARSSETRLVRLPLEASARRPAELRSRTCAA